MIFDPAPYYGDRETDIAMTELFGRFSNNFYEAYREEYPLDQNYEVRKKLYNLYGVTIANHKQITNIKINLITSQISYHSPI